MSNYRKSLPPLDNLLFFHAAAQNNSLTLAADELFVTQAAVSKRIKRLEEWLGTQLFLRAGRSLEITEAGKALASEVELALEFLDRAVTKVKAPSRSLVRIAANNALAMFWLYARLKAFSLSDAACDVNVVTTELTTELLSEDHDLAIIYCDGDMPGWDCVSLVDVEMIAAAAPEVAKQAERSKMFSLVHPSSNAPPLLEYDNLTPDWINWNTWLNDFGLPNTRNRLTIHCNSYVQSIGKALEGTGIALINAAVMGVELNSGALVKVGTMSMRPRKSYQLCYRKNAIKSQNARDLVAFLTG